jgi:chromosome segregation ATPase
MNKERRKALESLAAELTDLTGKMEEIKGQVESLRDEEQDYLDSIIEASEEVGNHIQEAKS